MRRLRRRVPQKKQPASKVTKQRAAAEAARQQEAEQRSAAEIARSEAISQTRIARVNVLTLLSDKLIAEQHDTALLLSAQAYNILDTPLTRSNSAHRAGIQSRLRGFPAYQRGFDRPAGLQSRREDRPAVSGNDRTIQLWIWARGNL